MVFRLFSWRTVQVNSLGRLRSGGNFRVFQTPLLYKERENQIWYKEKTRRKSKGKTRRNAIFRKRSPLGSDAIVSFRLAKEVLVREGSLIPELIILSTELDNTPGG